MFRNNATTLNPTESFGDHADETHHRNARSTSTFDIYQVPYSTVSYENVLACSLDPSSAINVDESQKSTMTLVTMSHRVGIHIQLECGVSVSDLGISKRQKGRSRGCNRNGDIRTKWKVEDTLQYVGCI
jgi:hypothetical protein